MTRRSAGLHLALLAAGLASPFVFPGHTVQLAVFWIMVLFALTWDTMGGQMGYNSLGNILFFGLGMYICALAQVGLVYDIGEYTAASGAISIDFSDRDYFLGLALGIGLAPVGAVLAAVALSWVLFGVRGPYFAIGTLGAAIAAAELTNAWEWVGGGQGIAMPVFPGGPGMRERFYYFACLAACVACYLFLRWLYSTRFRLAINAIRDDEDKAEALGLHTRRYKMVAWSVSAFGVFMVAMTLLGGKGTLWGPIIGATLFYAIREVTWTYLLGWQYIALGVLIIVNVVYFQQGILGWVRSRKPERVRERIEPEPAGARGETRKTANA